MHLRKSGTAAVIAMEGVESRLLMTGAADATVSKALDASSTLLFNDATPTGTVVVRSWEHQYEFRPGK